MALLPAVPLLNTASILPGVASDDLQLSSNSPPAGSYHKVVIGSGNAALGFVIAEERARLVKALQVRRYSTQYRTIPHDTVHV